MLLLPVWIVVLVLLIGCSSESKNPVHITQMSNIELALDDTVLVEIYRITIITENGDTTTYFEKKAEGNIKLSVPCDYSTSVNVDIYNMNKKTSAGFIQLPQGASGIFNLSVIPISENTEQSKIPNGLYASSISTTSIKISFNAVELAQNYRLYVSNDDVTFTLLAEITTLSYTHNGLESGITFYYKVSSVVDDKESEKSVSVSATTQVSKTIYVIDPSKCRGCGVCRSSCKYDAISKSGSVYVIDPSRCTGCGECVKNCPQSAISIQ